MHSQKVICPRCYKNSAQNVVSKILRSVAFLPSPTDAWSYLDVGTLVKLQGRRFCSLRSSLEMVEKHVLIANGCYTEDDSGLEEQLPQHSIVICTDTKV